MGIGGENVNANASGAYTGEIAANMLVDAGCKYVIIGHPSAGLWVRRMPM